MVKNRLQCSVGEKGLGENLRQGYIRFHQAYLTFLETCSYNISKFVFARVPVRDAQHIITTVNFQPRFFHHWQIFLFRTYSHVATMILVQWLYISEYIYWNFKLAKTFLMLKPIVCYRGGDFSINLYQRSNISLQN